MTRAVRCSRLMAIVPSRFRGALAPAAAALFASCALVLALTPAGASADSCPNAQFRTGYSAYLPDCRAYEMVSPPDKDGNDAGFALYSVLPAQSLASGSAVIYGSGGAFAGAPGANLNYYVGTREPGSWSTSPVKVPAEPAFVLGLPNLGVSADLSKQLVLTNAALTPDAVSGQQNLYLRDGASGSYRLIGADSSGSWAFNAPIFDGAASDGSHFLFDTSVALNSTPAPPSGASDNLYDWTGDQLKLVGVLPDGTVDANGAQAAEAHGSLLTDALYFHAVSKDGTRVYWTEPGGAPIYLRQNDATTTAITVSQRGPNPSPTPQQGHLWFATPDGSKAYFTSTAQLTDDTSVNYGNNGDLYQYDVASGQLTDITVDSNATDAHGADVPSVLGVSSSASAGTYVYFVALGVLTSTPNSRGQTASAGAHNLYVWHDDGSATSIRFIASSPDLGPNDGQAGSLFGNDVTEVEDVSPDGAHLAFMSRAPLTGYDNTDATTGSPDLEVFLYDARTDTLACASCNPSGAAPMGSAGFHQSLTIAALGSFTTRNVPDDGRVFFESPDQLLPQDSNQAVDVYEFEQDGVGGCGQAGGCLHLISSGRSDTDSYFADASASGDDVFFITRQQLIGQDGDTNHDLYDARVGGGLPAPPAPPPACSGEDCHGQSSNAPPAPLAASVTFFGPGNLSAGGSPTASVKVLRRAVHGSTFLVGVRVPAKGRVTGAAAGVRTVTRSLARAGTYRLRVTLTPKAKRELRRKRTLKLRLRVHYVPADGTPSSTTVSLTVKA